jgi:hypothetical protein
VYVAAFCYYANATYIAYFDSWGISLFLTLGQTEGGKGQRVYGWHDYRELFFEQAQDSALSDIKTETSNLKFEVWLF